MVAGELALDRFFYLTCMEVHTALASSCLAEVKVLLPRAALAAIAVGIRGIRDLRLSKLTAFFDGLTLISMSNK